MASLIVLKHPDKARPKKLPVGLNWTILAAALGLAGLIAQPIFLGRFGGAIGGASIGLFVAGLISGLGPAFWARKMIDRLQRKGWQVSEVKGDKARAVVDAVKGG
jgi:hypothetical protein